MSAAKLAADVKFAKPGFQFGLSRPLEVREEFIREHPHPCRLAYVSDIHLRRGRSQLLSDQVIDALERAQPDVVLLGGDYVDQASEIGALQQLLERIRNIAPAFAIPGNHDIAVGEDLVRQAVEETGIAWIPDKTVDFQHGERRITISGPDSEPDADADFRVLCAHNPRIWRTARNAGFDLVLAGHLHACQGVLFEAGGRLFPGAFFYPHNHIRQNHNGSKLVVSMACSDLIPIRWGCPREIVLCIL